MGLFFLPTVGTGLLATVRLHCTQDYVCINSSTYQFFSCTMEYQKVGRGGAGNFYSPQDLEKASKETDKVRKPSHVFDRDRDRSDDF